MLGYPQNKGETTRRVFFSGSSFPCERGEETGKKLAKTTGQTDKRSACPVVCSSNRKLSSDSSTDGLSIFMRKNVKKIIVIEYILENIQANKSN